MWLFGGGKTTLMPGSLDPEAVWQAVAGRGGQLHHRRRRRRGQAADGRAGTPTRAAGTCRRCSRSANGGAPLSPSLKARISPTFPDKMIIDGMGSSETGAQGSAAAASRARRAGGPAWPRSPPSRTPACSTSDREPVAPGLGRDRPAGPHRAHPARLPRRPGEDGRDVRRGRRRSATCFTGDMATVEADGTDPAARPRVAVHQHRRREGLPRGGRGRPPRPPRRGRRPRRRRARRALGERGHRRRRSRHGARPRRSRSCASTAGPRWPATSCPKHLVVVDQVQRSPAGKADYRWAEATAKASLSSSFAVGVNRTFIDS